MARVLSSMVWLSLGLHCCQHVMGKDLVFRGAMFEVCDKVLVALLCNWSLLVCWAVAKFARHCFNCRSLSVGSDAVRLLAINCSLLESVFDWRAAVNRAQVAVAIAISKNVSAIEVCTFAPCSCGHGAVAVRAINHGAL